MFGLNFDFLTSDIFVALGHGMLSTIRITLTAVVAGLIFGVLLALMRLSKFRALYLFAKCYTTLFRAMPLTMVLLGFYLVVPNMLQSLIPQSAAWDTRMSSALIGFSLFEAAYYCEIIRAGIQSVPKGQFEAGQALGMTYPGIYAQIILPQSFRKMIPLLLTQMIVLFQDTSLVFVITLSDFFTSAENIGERDGRLAEMMLIAGGIYFLICFLASKAVNYMASRKPA